MNEITTTDFSKFGYRERRIAEELLREWNKDNLPEDFEYDEVTIMFNTHSGNVFLTNGSFQVAMMNDTGLESFYTCPYCGHEGFKEDMEHEPENAECAEYMREIGITEDDEPEEE